MRKNRLLLVLLWALMPIVTWAADNGLETAFVGDKSYYVLRSADDWNKFRQLVADAGGKSEVNAIMDADFSVSNPVGLDVAPYRGTFNGNGHTLNVNIDWGSNYYAAPFPSVNQATFKNLTVTGSVKGSVHCAGLIGHSYGSSPSFTIEKVRVSTNVTITESHVGGFIGHAGDAEVNMTDCLADGSITANGPDAYSGTFVGWASSGGKWYFHRVYESVTFTGVAHQSVCYYYDGGAKFWGYNSSSTLIVASHNWGEMASGCKSITNQKTVANKMNAEKANTWQVVDGRAVPIMQTWPSADDVNFATYDIVPGTESGEEGKVKMPFSCDQAVKNLDITYTNENGETKTIHMDCDKDTYAGFILLPATEQHKSLTIKAKLLVGTVTKSVDDKNDALMHKPLHLTAQLLDYSTTKKLADAGVVEVKWTVDAPKYSDVISSDVFNVMRSLTGKEEDMESIGSIPFEEGTASYTFRDETLMSALTAEQIDANTAMQQVQYRVVRAATQQLWGFSNTTASAQTVCPLSILHLLRVKDYQAAWADQTARTVKVTWSYADELGAVWDSRAKMNIVVSSTNRAGAAVDVNTYELTADEMAACQKEIQLSRSCVDYKIVFDVERGESTIPVEAPFFEIRTAEDWTTFVAKVKAANGQYNVNASLLADITVNEIAAYEGKYAYRGTFEGNGHTLNLNISDNGSNAGLFSHVATATFRNLNLTGTLSTSQIHIGSLIGFVEKDATVTIENCHSSVKLVSSRNGDAYMGGFVGHSGGGSKQLTINNCVFDGSFEGSNAQRNGGFVGWTPSNSGKVNITNCLFAPAAINTKFTYCDTWVWTNNPEKVTVTNSYATRDYNSSSNTQYANYFLINNAADWETFRTKVEEAGGNSDVNAVLNADITISNSVGYNNSYRGKFDGNGHMLTLNFNTSEQYTAPFRYVAGATIYTLRVAGTATSSAKFVAGIVGACSGGTNEIICCRVSATIDSSIDGDATNGGLVSVVGTNATLEITDCLFDGKFTGDKCYANGGFVGFNDGKTTIKNSLFNGTSTTKTSGCRTFARSRDYNKLTLTNNYYTNAMDDGDTKQGTSTAGIANSLLADKLEKYVWRIWDGIVVPVSSPLVTIGNMAGKTADQIIALLGSGWTKNANGQVTPKMADNKQEEIPYSAKHPFMIHSAADWDVFRQMVADAKGEKDIYAQLMADISITEPAGVSTGYFRGTFDGCGHTLTVNLDKNWDCVAPFQNVIGNTTIRNLNVTGTIKGRIHSAGVVGNVDESATLVIESSHVSASITTTNKYAGGFVGHAHETQTTVRNCLFDGSITASSGNYVGAFIGWSAQKSTVENCLENGTYTGFVHAGVNYRTFNDVFGGTNNYTYKDWGECNKVGARTAAAVVEALGSMWQLSVTGKPVPKNIGGVIDGMPTFYYENMGHIDQNSLQVRTLPTSTVLTWANETEEPVDYYEVWRKDKEDADFGKKPIATQISDTQYEDKDTSPVQQYVYKVRGVTDCEGIHFDETKEVEGMCEQFATVEGYLRFLDGTGIPGEKIKVTVNDEEVSTTTDESGFFRLKELPYIDKKQTIYQLVTSIDGVLGTATFGTAPGENVLKNVVIEVGSSVKIAGYVQYEGTSIPVQGVSFLVNGHEVRTAAGKVETDHEGKFSFRMLSGNASIQAVKDGHTFWRDGFYHQDDNDPDTLTTYNFKTDKAGLIFYDTKRVKLTGRIVGGKEQGEKPLGYGLSTNNLGDSLKMVLTLEGDNASRLVFDIQDRNLKERDEVFEHKAANEKDKKYTQQTKVHTTLNRKVVYPDVHTGEYEVMLPPVKWKIQQITASGYATLFQDGQTGDVIDLSDSLTSHKDVVKGTWQTIGSKKDVINPVEEYHAKYSRIYHSPVIIDYKQQGFDEFDYFGDRYYSYQNLNGDKEKLSLAYGVKKKDWPEGKRDSLETHYTFGHPVFNIDRKYGFTISAVEKYYYNNNTKSDTIDVVKLSGGVVTIHNGMISDTHCDTLHLDSLGQGNYTIEAAQTPYLLTGEDALSTVSMTLEMDGTHYEAEPLKAYVLNIKPKEGATDILTFSSPQLIDILRDPPGGGSKATLSKGSTLKYAYQMDMSWSAGVSFTFSTGSGLNSFTGVVAAPMGAGGVGGFNTIASSDLSTSLDLVWSGSGNRAFNYTMNVNEDISTSADKKLIGANGDVYIGVVQNIVVKPATAIRAIPHSAFLQMAGSVEKDRMVEIAQGRDEKNNLLHFVRDEVVTYGPELTSNFVHSQYYLINQLIPELAEEIYGLMFIGTKEEAQAKANSSGKPVYRSMVGTDDPDFGASKYEVIYPDGYTGSRVDKVSAFHNAMVKWVEMIGQNEQEKLSVQAKNLVKNFDIDGGTSMSYGESFTSDYSNTSSFVMPFGSAASDYFENKGGDVTLSILAVLGPTAAKLLSSVLKTKTGATQGATGTGKDKGGHMQVEVQALGTTFHFGLIPSMSFDVKPKSTESKAYTRKESFTISMDKKSHLDFDVYYVTPSSQKTGGNLSAMDVFYNKNFFEQAEDNKDYLKRHLKLEDYDTPRSFVYRTRGGATCRPWEGERTTNFYQPGTVLDERTKKIENPQIKMDKQSLSGVPYGEAARFKIYLTNESEQPEAVYNYFDLYQVEKSNPKGVKMMIDGMPLTGNSRTIEVRPGVVTEKTLEVYAGEDFDYENLEIGIISQGDLNAYSQVAFDVHYLQTAGGIAISSPGDKWIMNCDAPTDGNKGWYLPVVISGFDKNQHNFDHIEFQYKETTRGDDYWTNLCGYYADSTIYKAASGTKEMIPENGYINARFFGEGVVMEKGYDLRAVLFCRNGNAFLTNESKVLSGVKDTRRPQLFGTPEPKTGVAEVGDNIIFNFSEDIEYNYLQATTNFEVVGETNETAVQEAPSLQFGGNGFAQTEVRRNFSDKNVTVEVMIKPDEVAKDMPIFSHGSEGKHLQLWLTQDKRLMAIVENGDRPYILESKTPLTSKGFQRVAMVLNNEKKQLMLYADEQVGKMDSVTYNGYGPLTFGYGETINSGEPSYYEGRMLQGRVWYRALDLAGLSRYGNRMLTGYELGLADYYPMNDGRGDYASDLAQGAHLALNGASWALPEGMSLKIDNSKATDEENDPVFKISTDADWNTFRQMVADAKGEYDIYAQLMADINITEPVGVGSARFRGDFNGNGHTLNCNIGSHGNCTAPIQYVTGISTIRNVNVSGSITGSWHSSGLVGHVESGSNVVVTNCRVSPKVTVYVRGGGIVGYADAGTLTVRNCRFDGSVHHTGFYLEKDNSAASFAGAFVGCATSNTTLAVENCLDYGGYFDFYGRYSSCYINKSRWAGTNNWTRNAKVAQVINNVGNLSAEELAKALGNEWTVSNGTAVPRVNNNHNIYMADKAKGLQLRTDLFQRNDEEDYTLMFWFKTAQENGTLMANGSGAADDEGARNKFFIGFEDNKLKYRTNGREFALEGNYSDDAWHHYAMTVNRMRNVASIYVDNELKAQLTTDTLGGMLGTRFFLGDMVWQKSGDPTLYEANAFTGHIDGLALFEQALPTTLIKRYSTKSPGGSERGLLAYMSFDHQERQKSGELTLQPNALSSKVKVDNDGNVLDKRDSVFVNPVDDILARIDRNTGAPVQAYEQLRNLNFSYVGRDNQLLVNIDEQDSRINKHNVYVTLYDIPDKNGNFMKSPATECFFVDRNPLQWGEKRVTTSMKAGYERELFLQIVNKGGKAHTYTIENLPRWMTPDKTSNVVDAMSTDNIDISISKDINVGTYDQIIYLTDENGLSEPLPIVLTVEGESPEWRVDQDLKRYSMNIVAQVYVGNSIVTEPQDMVAAFDAAGRCMGVNNIKYDANTGRSMLYMTIYDSTTVASTLTFQLWHYATGKTMMLNTVPEEIRFAEQTTVGTVSNPVQMYATERYKQTIDLAEGWNWISFYVHNQAFADLSTILGRFPWQEGDILTEDSQDLTLVYRNGKWMSNAGKDIDNIDLSQEFSYKVKVQDDHRVEIWGEAYKDEKDRTISVRPGWNSIGYTPLVNLPVATALTEYFDDATDGDVIKNQYEFAMFESDGKGGGEWLGTLEYMKPGEGYMLHRLSDTPTSFCYPYYEPGATFIGTPSTQRRAAALNYATTMNIVAQVEGIEVEDGDKLVAYADGEECGSITINSQRSTVSYLSIEGEKEAPLSFAIERDGDIIATTGEVMTYKVNGISGTPSEPTTISFVKASQLPKEGWYTLQGIQLPQAPTHPGVYIYNGKKHIIK
ncbi:MAG: LamG domain-containing protein [Bacteroidales bacterium]|nr:LamG domain-containing protein [Bacteroidales bacterium]